MSKTIFPLLCCALFFSCAKPTDPETLYLSGGYTVVGRFATPGYAQDVEVRDTIAYVAQGEGGLAIVSIADRGNPRLLSICQEGVKGYSYKITLKDSTAYLAAGAYHVNTVNIGNPLQPSAYPAQGTRSTMDVQVFGTWLLASCGEYGLQVGDLGTAPPGYVDFRGEISNPGYGHGMTTTADSMLLLTCGEMGLAVYNLRDIGWYGGGLGGGYDSRKGYDAWTDLPGYAVDVTTMGNQPIAFVACGTAGVYVVDFADSGHARVIGAYGTGGYAKEVAYQNNRLYVTTELRGLQILSVADPASPQLIGAIHTSYAVGVAVDEHYVYVSDETEGLIVVAIPPY